MKDFVIILGAGAAGLMAAHRLKIQKKNFVVLEARDRVGGRVLTTNSNPVIELGPEFLHGKTPLTDSLMDRFRLYDFPLQFDYRSFADGRLKKAERYWQRLSEVISSIRAPGRDQSFADYLQHKDRHKIENRNLAKAFVEGFYAADLNRISAQALKEMKDQVGDADSRKMRRLLTGYGPLMEALARPFARQLRLSHAVDSVIWQKGSVKVSGRRGKSRSPFSLKGTKVLITLPLGVLKNGSLEIFPMPKAFQDLLSQNHMGQVVKRVIEMDRAFFKTYEDGGFPFVVSPNLHFTAWWGSNPVHWPLLTAWAGGEHARKLAKLSFGRRSELMIEDLMRLTGRSRKQIEASIVKVHEHDWSHDPYSRGAYSYPAVRNKKPARLRLSYQHTLFFAGECFHEEMSGTVEGALVTGGEAARKILKG